MSRLIELCVVLSSVACVVVGCASELEPREHTEPIVDTPASEPGAFPSVVGVSIGAGVTHDFCTGVVIGPYAVLTAAACVPQGAGPIEVVEGEDARYVRDRLAVDHVAYEPVDGALAILVMEQPLEVENVQVSEAGAPEGELTVVGYGLGGGGASVLGVKRAVSFDAETGALAGADTSLCFGDLGAPVLDGSGQLVGFVSSLDLTCRPRDTLSRWSSTAPYATFVERAVEMVPGCLTPTDC